MLVKWTRPHVGGSMSGVGNDIKIESLSDTDEGGKPAKVPDGADLVKDPAAVAQDWTWERAGAFGGVN